MSIAAATLAAIERHRDRAVRPQLLDHLQPQPPLHQGARLGPVQVVQHRHAQVADFQDVAEAPVVISAVRAPLPSSMVLEPIVVPCSTSVTVAAVRRQQRTQAVDDAVAVVVRGGGDLVRDHAPIRGDCHEVGEGAADVDADALRHAGQLTMLGDARPSLSLRAQRSNPHPGAHRDRDCRVAALLTRNRSLRRHFHRHGRACPAISRGTLPLRMAGQARP